MGPTLRRLMWFCGGTLLAVALIEGVLRFLPVSTVLHRTEQAERWPLQNTNPRLDYTYSITWAMLNAHRGVTNNYGHVSPFDYHKHSQPVIVVGDSYIESLMNEPADTLQGQLGRKMGAPQSVYGFGVSGLSVSDYVALSRMARSEFNPAAAIFLVTDGDLSESLVARRGSHYLRRNGHGFSLDYQPARSESWASRMRKVIGEISIHRYMQVNLQFSADKIMEIFTKHSPSDAAVRPPSSERKIAAQREVADWFLSELTTSLGVPAECIVLLIDTDRYAIYKAQLATPRKDSPQARQYLIDRAQELGFKVSDMEPVFRQRFAQDRTPFDHWPIDRHWNKVGHGAGADEAYRLLFQPDPRAPRGCLAAKRAWN